MVLSEKNVEILYFSIEGLEDRVLKRVNGVLNKDGDPASGFREDAIRYLVRPNGLSGLKDEIDLTISCAVLDHVNDLSSSVYDMFDVLKPGGRAIHKVDLTSHGLHRRNPLDFLIWPMCQNSYG